MGSGSSGPYGGGSTGSQPYAPSYHVVPDMLTTDKKDSDIYKSNSGYFKNPTATNLENAIDGNRVVFNGKSVEGQFTYVMDTNGNITIIIQDSSKFNFFNYFFLHINIKAE